MQSKEIKGNNKDVRRNHGNRKQKSQRKKFKDTKVWFPGKMN